MFSSRFWNARYWNARFFSAVAGGQAGVDPVAGSSVINTAISIRL